MTLFNILRVDAILLEDGHQSTSCLHGKTLRNLVQVTTLQRYIEVSHHTASQNSKMGASSSEGSFGTTRNNMCGYRHIICMSCMNTILHSTCSDMNRAVKVCTVITLNIVCHYCNKAMSLNLGTNTRNWIHNSSKASLRRLTLAVRCLLAISAIPRNVHNHLLSLTLLRASLSDEAYPTPL